MYTPVTLSALDWFVFCLLLPPTHYQRQLASFQARQETRNSGANSRVRLCHRVPVCYLNTTQALVAAQNTRSSLAPPGSEAEVSGDSGFTLTATFAALLQSRSAH